MVYNFNAGPSTLPQAVLEEASKAIINFNNSGLSILEIGHRTPLFESVMEEARSLVRELMNLDDDHEVLYLHGGATVQFMQVPMNLLDENETVAIAETDVWGTKAIKEAKLFGKVDVVCTSKDNNFNYIPKDFTIPDTVKYFHITSNNTIYGTQWQKIPEVKVPLVADMSSDILSRKLDFNSFDLIYAGAQKNMGAAGTNLVVVNKNILGKIKRPIPAIMDYRNHINAKSMLNTPPVFAIYVSMLTLRWLKENGGVEAIEKRNNEKAALLYNAIDNSSIFIPTVVKKEDRSKMNVCFVMKDKEMEKSFLEFSQKNNIYGIKGHRTVGGFRASLYNALPLSSVEYLVGKMEEFEKGI
ncbi:MAG TPA: 3-phosphoserine/phosphohydroxythreonine transaminase [Hanamia sp.]|nr:3-phosphoserine/phosphohydroxythreonine transaminase [Hanamia sp.]